MDVGSLQPINLPSVLQQDLELTFPSADELRKPRYSQMHMHSHFKLLKLTASSASLESSSYILIITEVTKALLNTTFD